MRWTAALLLSVGPALAAPDIDQLRSRGHSGLGPLLALADSADPDVRLRARRAAKEIALEVMRARTPEGMRLVPGRLRVSASAVRSEGGLYLSTHEVTRAEWRKFVLAVRKRREVKPLTAAEGGLPATRVSHKDALDYARWKGARLPTFDELVFAMTAGGRLVYPWGNVFDPRCANTPKGGVGKPEPVGSRPRGRSPHGVEDLVGNVAEWTSTPRGAHRLIAGGSWKTELSREHKPTYSLYPEASGLDIGFRLAKSLEPVLPLPEPKPSEPGSEQPPGAEESKSGAD